MVTGEAPIESSSASGHAQYEPERKERKTEKPRIDATNKVHRASNGVYTHNRRGMPLCQEFQTGNCYSTSGIFCPVHNGAVHQCNKCLAEKHGGSACNLTPREPSYGKGRGKKGKGRGKRHE